MGGIGKSRLLSEFRRILAQEDNLVTASLDLASPIHSSALEFFLDLRSQLSIQTPLFDYAAARLLTLSGKSLKQLEPKWLKNSGLLFDFVELAADIADTVAPARLIARLAKRTSEASMRYLSELKEDFARIDVLSEKELNKYLPLYLGSGINAHFKSVQSQLIVSIDHYDARVEWLSELVGCSECGLWLVASRDRLRWADDNSDWKAHITHYSLGPLTNQDADLILQAIPIPEADIRSTIVRVASGIPSHLELCGNTYLLKKAAGESVVAADLDIHMMEMVQLFLGHLDISRQEALKAFSLLSAFDSSLFDAIVKQLNLNIPSSYFEEFCASTYLVSLDSEDEYFEVLPLIRDQARKSVPASRIDSVLSALVNELTMSLSDRRLSRALWLFEEVLMMAEVYTCNIVGQRAQRMAQSGVSLIESGYWRRVLDLIEAHPSSEAASSPGQLSISIVLTFLRALCLRKNGDLSASNESYTQLTDQVELFGEYAPLVSYYSAHVEHLLGQYDQAASNYTRLTQSPNHLVSLLARRQIADIYMLQGHFREALEKFIELVDLNPSDVLWKPETLRFVGHVHRFNFDFDSALTAYEKARTIAQGVGADAMLGKVLTNYVECECWSNPRQAVLTADTAVSMNLDNGNKIEVGKVYAAVAIAHTRLGQYEAAQEFVSQSIEIQRSTGYRSGVLFGQCAGAFLAYTQGDETEAIKYLVEAEKLSNELGVYNFLLFPLRHVLGRKGSTAEPQWLDKDTLLASIEQLIPGKSV